MTVTCELEYNWVTIKLDGEIIRKLHVSIIGDSPKIDMQEVDEAILLQQIHLLEAAGARQYALRRVAAQAMLSMKLREALSEKGVKDPIIDEIIHKFQESGYINDEEWIASFVRVQKQKRIGPRMIADKLRAKGVPRELFESQLEEDDPKERLKQLIATKYASRDLTDFKERQKVIASLARKGYSFDDILNIL